MGGRVSPKSAMEKEMISLNEDLLSDLEIEGLEERLATDPLLVSGLFMDGTIQAADCFCSPICDGFCNPIWG